VGAQPFTEFLVLGTITSNQPDNMLPARQWKIPAGVDLADPEFHKPQRIDILLGADSFLDLLCGLMVESNSPMDVHCYKKHYWDGLFLDGVSNNKKKILLVSPCRRKTWF